MDDCRGPFRAKVLIVDDHPVAREGLSLHIELQPDLEVCGEADDMASALTLVETAHPDLAVIDLSLKSGNGIDLVKRLKSRQPTLAMLVWSMHDDPLYAERALTAGALGYVHKGHATREIIDAIRSVLAGQIFISGNLSREVLARMTGRKARSDDRGAIERLSDRELEAFGLMGQGLTTLQIAARMCLSSKTVETYRIRIKEKLGLASFSEVIRRAVQWVNGMWPHSPS